MNSVAQPVALTRGRIRILIEDYAELTKARVTSLVVMTAWCGYYFGANASGVSSLTWGLFTLCSVSDLCLPERLH